MSPLVIAAAAILVMASAAFVLIGSVYKWDLTSPGYALWTQVVGAVAVIALGAVAAWSRIERPYLAAAIVLGGVALAVGYVILHRRLTDRVRGMLHPVDDGR